MAWTFGSTSAVGTALSRWTIVTFVGLTALGVLAACGDDQQAGAQSTVHPIGNADQATTPPPDRPTGDAAVTITDFAFSPSPVTVPAGGTVTWTNNDEAAHSIRDTSPKASPESESLKRGDTFSITYPGPGTYPYVCGIHDYMQGSVEVKG